MPDIEELQEKKKELEKELEKPPHKRDARLTQNQTLNSRIQQIEQKIERKKQRKENLQRKKETRRKILLGAGFLYEVEKQEKPLDEQLKHFGWYEELGEDYPDLFAGIYNHGNPKKASSEQTRHERRMIILGGLILRDFSYDDYEKLLENVLAE
ncbi:MAG: hypothetical protein ABEJ65_11195, partial [bacterium]